MTRRCYVHGCPRPPKGATVRCAHHLEMAVAANRKARQYRALLGLCSDCTRPPQPGYQRCPTCRRRAIATHRRRREREAKARGWKMVKVAL